MADTSTVNPQNATNEPANARKKRTKSVTATSNALATTDASALSKSDEYKANGTDGTYESSYIREVQKNIRNVTKKLNSMQKVDAIISENPNQSLDELITARKINADQKAQALKKPALQAQLSQLEDQITHYRKLDQDYQKRMVKEREDLEKAHAEEIEKLKEAYQAEAQQETPSLLKHHLLTLSRFLRAAAARRQRDDDDSEESKAFEGALLLIYGGDHGAVAAAEKLIEQSDDNIPSTEGVTLQVTYAQIMQAALAETVLPQENGEEVDSIAQAEKSATVDPTVANAGLTEIDSKPLQLDEPGMENNASIAPEQASVDASAANATAEEQWDSRITPTEGLGESFEMVPRNTSENEAKPVMASALPSAPVSAPKQNTQSWADESPAEPPLAQENTKLMPNGNDGFREVHHGRGGRSRGGYHGDYRGGFRGRYRGDGLGYRNRGHRGRGGGFRGGFRGRDNANT